MRALILHQQQDEKQKREINISLLEKSPHAFITGEQLCRDLPVPALYRYSSSLWRYFLSSPPVFSCLTSVLTFSSLRRDTFKSRV